jgi:hypothetical protein
MPFQGPRCGDNDWVMKEGVNVMKRENTGNIYSSQKLLPQIIS